MEKYSSLLSSLGQGKVKIDQDLVTFNVKEKVLTCDIHLEEGLFYFIYLFYLLLWTGVPEFSKKT